jgi:phosphonate transport system permease protein
MPGLDRALSQLRLFFPPDWSVAYLKAEGVPLLQTVEMAAGAMLFAGIAGLLMALYIGARLPGSRLLYSCLATVRAIPDLTLAILCVMLVGIGPAAGLLALSVFYTAAMGKIFADLFVSADPGPVDILRATGAGSVSVALFGLLPLRLNDLLTYGAYEFESAMRAAVIVGTVAAGGIGTELVSAINETDYRHVTTLVIMLTVLIAVFDKLAWLVRRYPPLLLLFVVGGSISAWINRPQMFAWSFFGSRLQKMWPPRIPVHDLSNVPALIAETLMIALGGTVLAVLFAIPLGTAAARNLSPAWIYTPVRRFLELLRAIPEVIWGLILVVTAGIGWHAGALALGLHSTGVFGKLYAESIENVPPEPVIALAATGGPQVSIASFAMLPLAFPPMIVHTLFRLEWNMRASTVVGLIGAGGIGGALYNAQQLMFYNQALAYILITWALIMLMDLLNAQLRKRWKIAEGRA